MKISVIIPFRSRGTDPLREANLCRVMDEWHRLNRSPQVFSDGRLGRQPFNRSVAYNRAVQANPDTDVFVFTESDVLIGADQIDRAVELAVEQAGLVVPFTQFRALTHDDSKWVRVHASEPDGCLSHQVKADYQSIGAVNVISRKTYELTGGYDPHFEGAWYDDDAMKIAFEVCAGPTRWVDGPVYHLYHLPSGKGGHLTAQDRAATARNRTRLARYRRTKDPEQIRALISSARP